jgi:hypothetical protein
MLSLWSCVMGCSPVIRLRRVMALFLSVNILRMRLTSSCIMTQEALPTVIALAHDPNWLLNASYVKLFGGNMFNLSIVFWNWRSALYIVVWWASHGIAERCFNQKPSYGFALVGTLKLNPFSTYHPVTGSQVRLTTLLPIFAHIALIWLTRNQVQMKEN